MCLLLVYLPRTGLEKTMWDSWKNSGCNPEATASGCRGKLRQGAYALLHVPTNTTVNGKVRRPQRLFWILGWFWLETNMNLREPTMETSWDFKSIQTRDNSLISETSTMPHIATFLVPDAIAHCNSCPQMILSSAITFTGMETTAIVEGLLRGF